MKNTLILLCCLLLLSNCTSNNAKKTSWKTLHVKFENKKQLNYSDIFESCEPIYLDSTKDFLIDKIMQVKFFQNKIFVLDGKSRLFIYTDSGKGIAIIDNCGAGAHEYLYVRGFDIDSEKQELVLNTFPQSIMRFDFKGKFLSESKIVLNGTDVAVLGNNKIGLYTQNLENLNDTDNHHLFIFSELKGNDFNGYESSLLSTGRMLPVVQQMTVFSWFEKGHETLFVHPYSNKIIAIDRGLKPVVKYEIDVQGANLINILNKDKFNSHDEFSEVLRNNKNAYGINAFWENSAWISFSILIKGELTHFIFDKKDKKYESKCLKDDMLGIYPNPVCVTEDYLLCFASANDLFSIEDYAKMQGKQPVGNLATIIDRMKITENPVIIRYYFKK